MNGRLAGGDVVHSLWVTVALVAAAVSVTFAWSGRRRERAARRRTVTLLAMATTPDPGHARPEYRAWLRRWGPPLGAGCLGWALVGGAAGGAVGLAGAYAVARWLRTRPGTGAEADEVMAEAARQLPLAADLLAACVTAGAGPREAAEAVGESLGGPVGERLVSTAATLRLGGEPAATWGRFGGIPGAGELARCLERAGSTGAPAAEPVSRVADGLRAERARQATARAGRAQVLITAPVGLCFLPAFLAVGVAPVVIGLAAGLLGGE
ncbi:type II secretion system F family protein [Streptomyces sp. NBC_01498]|uniref:type II secretion system F family protein n=1 Tax=Streptomyces sp. NBC_01498 TaxID=2975870 RepID=UPI002E7BCDBC|nr:type II secretion system F family protein [Streptomyces sp. NBC_01498]WTL25466.1 type II secretion system F family protein [Streptomyces sp. NBC_01498]